MGPSYVGELGEWYAECKATFQLLHFPSPWGRHATGRHCVAEAVHSGVTVGNKVAGLEEESNREYGRFLSNLRFANDVVLFSRRAG